MRSHEFAAVTRLFVAALWLVIGMMTAPRAVAQGTPLPTAAAEQPTEQPAAPTETPTPTATRTPTLTPTPTATLTELQNRLLVADAYLKGGQFARAAELYTAILTTERGHPEALAGLKKALESQGTATAVAPRATPLPPTPTAVPGFSATLSDRAGDIVGTALAVLLVVLVLYLLAPGLRYVLIVLREFYCLRVRPLLRRPALARPFLIGEFADATGLPNFGGSQIVAHTLSEKLLEWSELVQAKEVLVEPAPALDLSGMAWLRELWSWVFPPERAYKLEGVLMGNQPGAYRLAVQRTDLSANIIDASCTFESTQPVAEAAFREMAAAAARWALHPRDIAASAAVQSGLRAQRSAGEGMPLSADEVLAEVIALLLPVRQQIGQGVLDHAEARARLQQAERLIADLPPSSHLHAELNDVIAELRRAVQES